jgi:hypothetical protein
MRNSIQPTYNHAETGDRFTVEYRINDQLLSATPITDPFVRGTVTIGWRDLLRCLLRLRATKVEFVVRGDHEIEEDVMELNSDYLGTHNSSRNIEFKSRLESSLSDFSYVCPE